MDEEIVYIPKYKKLWLSITKFERYPEMATEGVGRAIGYLIWLVIMFAFILSIALIIKFSDISKKTINFLDNNFNEISYSEGILTIDSINKSSTTDFGNIIINTGELTEEQQKEYENKRKYTNVEIVWLKEYVLLKYDKEVGKFYYKDILENFGINKFDKETIINYLRNQFSSPKIYIIYLVAITIYLFISYLIVFLLDTLMLSLFGVITTMFARIQIRYRAIFNMAVYSITLSTVLQLIYTIVKTFTGFNIKYFDLMYTAISFICLTAAIFMIKSDVIKQQLELMKIIDLKKNEQEENKEKDEQQEKEEKKEEDNDNEKENNTEDKKENKEDNPPNVEGQGSNA